MKQLFIISLILVGFNSCKKEVQPAADLIVGDKTGMKIQSEPITMNLCDGCKLIQPIDANGDEKADFRIIFEKATVTGGGSYPLAYFQSIHNKAFVSFYLEGFVSYLIHDADTVVNGQFVEITEKSGETCSQIPNSGQITHSYNKLRYLQILDAGDTIRNSDYWTSNNSIHIICPSYSYYEASNTPNTPDTSYYSYVTNDKSCYSAPYNQDIYIRIKVEEKKRVKLGWVVLNVNAERIIIKEVAMQE